MKYRILILYKEGISDYPSRRHSWLCRRKYVHEPYFINSEKELSASFSSKRGADAGFAVASKLVPEAESIHITVD